MTDHGAGMAGPLPSTAPDPCQEGGRGWFIIRQWMDEARYEQRAGENVLTMAKRIAG